MDEDIVVKQQDEIQIYANTSGGIVIRCNSQSDGEVHIVFDAIHAVAVASAIKRIAVHISMKDLHGDGGE